VDKNKLFFRKLYYGGKVLIKSRQFWVLLSAIIIFCSVLFTINLPDKENLSIGVVLNDSEYARRVIEIKDSSKSSFAFIPYENEELLNSDVLSGKLDSGFIFSKDADGLINKASYKNLFVQIVSPYTTKGELALERICSGIIRESGEKIIEDNYLNLFGIENNEDTSEYLSSRYEYYANSDDVFMVEYK